MKKFIQLVGTAKSGIESIAYMLSYNNVICGREMGNIVEGYKPNPYSPYYRSDGLFKSTYMHRINYQSRFIHTLQNLDQTDINEIRSLAAYTLSTGHWCLKNNTSMLITNVIWDIVKDSAHLIVCNRGKNETLNELRTKYEVDETEFNEGFDYWTTIIDNLRELYLTNNRPILELNYNDMNDNSNLVVHNLESFLGIKLECDIQDLGWLDTIINSFEGTF